MTAVWILQRGTTAKKKTLMATTVVRQGFGIKMKYKTCVGKE